MNKTLNNDLEKLNQQIKNSSLVVTSTHNLLNNILHWALIQINQLYFHQESINVYSIAEQVTYNFQSLISEINIFFENKICPKTKVYADQESLKITLRNLLDNPIKFTDRGGKITLFNTSSNKYSRYKKRNK